MGHLTWIALAMLCLLPDVAAADGKFYTVHKTPPDIPYQRAVVWFNGEREILLLQSRYDTSKGQPVSQLGWVVPVPATPDLATLTPEAADWLFLYLAQATEPEVIALGDYLSAFLAVLLPILLIILLVRLAAAVSARIVRGPGRYPKYVGSVTQNACLIFILAVIAIPNLMSAPRGASIEVVKAQEVGDYTVKVIRAEESSELIRWLNTNGFKFEASDQEAFTGYVSKKWYFVTVKISPHAKQPEKMLSREGLVQPLVLSFKTKDAVYPLILTGATQEPTELLLYVFHQHRMGSGDRLGVKFARSNMPADHYLKELIEPKGFLDTENFDDRFLTKFGGRLKPEQMRSDLVFTRAQHDESYRERTYTWFPRHTRALPRMPDRR